MRLVAVIIVTSALAAALAHSSSAHSPVGVYAGTHVVDLEPAPRSPFPNEEVFITIRIRDLSLRFAEEDFSVEVVILENADTDRETPIFQASAEKVKTGIWQTTYRFLKPGLYDVEVQFGLEEDPDRVREAVFQIEVRDQGVSMRTALGGAAAAAGIGLIIGSFIRLSRIRGLKSNE